MSVKLDVLVDAFFYHSCSLFRPLLIIRVKKENRQKQTRSYNWCAKAHGQGLILCHQKCPNASYFTWYLEVVHFHGKHPARNPIFFISHTHSECLRANSDILVSRVQVLNDLSNLIKTNLFFPFLSSKSICLYTNWHTFFFYETIIPIE